MIPGIDGKHKLTIEISADLLSELRYLLSLPGTVRITNQQAMDAIAKKKVRPVLSLEEKERINELVRTGRSTEATRFLTECRIRRAKLELLRVNRGAFARDSLIESLLREAIDARKESGKS